MKPWETQVFDAAPPSERGEERAVAGEELWLLGDHGSAGQVVTERTAIRVSALLAVVNVLATDVAALPCRVYQTMPDGSRKPRPDDPRDDLLNVSPDDETTAIRFRQDLMANALLYGNGYAEIVRTGRGTPAKLCLLSSETTEPFRDPTTKALKYRICGNKELDAGDVFHLAGIGRDGICGWNMVQLIRQAIGVAMAAEGYTGDYFENGSEPGGVIETIKQLKGDAAKNLRESWEAKHRGQGRRHRVAILEEGAKFNRTSSDPDKAQLLEARKYQVIDIARPWRVPPHKVGDFSQAHLANIEASNLDYLTTALMPWLVAWEQQAHLKLFSKAERRAGLYVEHQVEALLRGDITSRYAAYGQALDRGWMSRDEVRRKENMNPIGLAGGGSKYTVQLALTTLDQVGEDDPEPTPSTPPAGDRGPAADTSAAPAGDASNPDPDPNDEQPGA